MTGKNNGMVISKLDYEIANFGYLLGIEADSRLVENDDLRAAL